jgi:hypothetical protein
MAEKILFPDSPPARWLSERECVAFPAVRGESRLTCLATLELLLERFGARGPSEAEARRTYEIHRPRLQAIARSLILAGKVSDENEALLTTETFSLKKVAFGESVRESSYHFRLARQTTAELEEVLGSSAAYTEAEWDRVEDAEGRKLYVLTVRDFVTQRSVAFTPDQLEHPRDVRRRLYRLWGDLLQDRNHRQLQELLAARQTED